MIPWDMDKVCFPLSVLCLCVCASLCARREDEQGGVSKVDPPGAVSAQIPSLPSPAAPQSRGSRRDPGHEAPVRAGWLLPIPGSEPGWGAPWGDVPHISWGPLAVPCSLPRGCCRSGSWTVCLLSSSHRGFSSLPFVRTVVSRSPMAAWPQQGPACPGMAPAAAGALFHAGFLRICLGLDEECAFQLICADRETGHQSSSTSTPCKKAPGKWQLHREISHLSSSYFLICSH